MSTPKSITIPIGPQSQAAIGVDDHSHFFGPTIMKQRFIIIGTFILAMIGMTTMLQAQGNGTTVTKYDFENPY